MQSRSPPCVRHQYDECYRIAWTLAHRLDCNGFRLAFRHRAVFGRENKTRLVPAVHQFSLSGITSHRRAEHCGTWRSFDRLQGVSPANCSVCRKVRLRGFIAQLGQFWIFFIAVPVTKWCNHEGVHMAFGVQDRLRQSLNHLPRRRCFPYKKLGLGGHLERP